MPTLNTLRGALKQTAFAAVLLSPTVAFADWSGGYAGIQFDALTGDKFSVGIAAPDDSFEADAIFSGFAGYQLQQGDFVIGGELALGQANGYQFEDGDDFSTDVRLIDLKARVGYDLGQTLVYGVAGFSQTRLLDFDTEDEIGIDLDTATGVNYGIGVDYKITEQFTIGAEYLIREVSAEDDINDDFGIRTETQVETLGIRAAFNF